MDLKAKKNYCFLNSFLLYIILYKSKKKKNFILSLNKYIFI